MPLKKNALSTLLCMITVASVVLSALFIPAINADPADKTKLYFTDPLAIDYVEFDSTLMYPLLSEVPPTDDNASSYPPLFIEDVSLLQGIDFIDNETLVTWLATWSFNLLDDLLGDEEDYDDLDGLIDQLKLLLPNPLRIIEGYEYTGNESITIQGNFDFDLYFKTKIGSQIHKNDRVKISIYKYSPTGFIPVHIANKTISLTPGYLQDDIQQTISITNVSETINPGTSILIGVEMMPGNKTISSFIIKDRPVLDNLTKIALRAVRNVANLTGFTTIEDLITLFNEIKSIISNENSGFNLTVEDAADLIESLTSISFLCDSTTYPSSVTVPFKTEDDSDESSITYYLQTNNQMNSDRPVAGSQQIANLADSSISWMGPEITRNKYISDATAIVYINHKDLQIWEDPMVVEASLTYGNSTLDTDSITLDQKASLSASQRPYQFTFDDLDAEEELSYGNKIGLRLSLPEGTNVNSFLRTVEVFYASSDYTSMLSFSLSETDHIQVTGSRSPSNGFIIVGDTVEYKLTINSDLKDSISINIQDSSFSTDEKNNWDVSIDPESFSIEDTGTKTVDVLLTSIIETNESYDPQHPAYSKKPLDITLTVIGNTGIDDISLSADVNEDAVTFDTLITRPKDKEIVHGSNETFVFTVENNNTGLYKDSFIFSADSNKNISIVVHPLTFDNLAVGEKTNVTVNVSIPENTNIDDLTVTLTVKSKRSRIEQQIPVNITVIGANIFETMYNYFEDIADSLGLTDAFGSYAPIFLISIIFIVIFFILIIMAFILTNKFVDIICVDRIKEIHPDKTASYNIILKNTTNKTRSYILQSDIPLTSSSWMLEFSQNKVTIPPKQQQSVTATIRANDNVEPGDWAEFHLMVSTEGKSKVETISLFCSLADGSVDLSIKKVFHWPKTFSKDQKVSTSLRLENNGNVQAKNVSVKLFINNKEKNKVEELIIPAGGYADITLPWIAEKGKNDLRIMVA